MTDAPWDQALCLLRDLRPVGLGHLRGLISKLDYCAWLGIDCLRLPPFCDSPGRDRGYNIRDYFQVSADFGTVEDFAELVKAAHYHGIRVIADLVLNHTSDSHRWFQQSRSDSASLDGFLLN